MRSDSCLRNHLFCFGLLAILSISIVTPFSHAQVPNKTMDPLSVKIVSPSNGDSVPVGDLSIQGISYDNSTTDCAVFVDWNDMKPFQNVVATGPGGSKDFSTWKFNFNSSYHQIATGQNELTSKISCFDEYNQGSKWNSINVTGVDNKKTTSEEVLDNTSSSANKDVPVVASENDSLNDTNKTNSTSFDIKIPKQIQPAAEDESIQPAAEDESIQPAA